MHWLEQFWRNFCKLEGDILFISIRFDNFNFHQQFKISFVCHCIKMHQVFALWFTRMKKIIMRLEFGTGKTSSLQTSFSSSKQASKVYLNSILGRMYLTESYLMQGNIQKHILGPLHVLWQVSRDLSQADKSIIRVSSFPKLFLNDKVSR